LDGKKPREGLINKTNVWADKGPAVPWI